MALDAIALSAQTLYLNNLLSSGKVDRILQPSDDEIILHIYLNKKTHKLLLSCNSNYPRIHLTLQSYTNPQNAPSFCMHLRKRLLNATITGITSPEFERMVDIAFLSKTELNDTAVMHLILEITGRSSNLIATDGEHKISACLKAVPIDTQSDRQLLQGLKYTPLKQTAKSTVRDKTALEEHLKAFSGGNLSEYFLSGFYGYAASTVNEVLFSVLGTDPKNVSALDNTKINSIISAFNGQSDNINYSAPAYLLRDSKGAAADFGLSDFKYALQNPDMSGAVSEKRENIDVCIAEFFSVRDTNQKRNSLIKPVAAVIKNAAARAEKRICELESKLKSCVDKDKYLLYGELLTANIYKSGEWTGKTVVLNNYYTGDDVAIPLQPLIKNNQLPAHYYKLAAKLKRAEPLISKQLSETYEQLDYLNSVRAQLENCETAAEINDIRDELSDFGILKKGSQTKGKPEISKPHMFTVKGYNIYVGKNNLQNDKLTRESRSTDIWLHALGTHGSHTVIQSKPGVEIPHEVIVAAAEIAAFYSKARSAGKTNVDYTYIKYVRKPAKSLPGKVIYTNQTTLTVIPGISNKAILR